MFEKEAKERARELEESQTVGVYDNDEDLARDIGWNEGEVAGYEEGFRDGAEFGYNKYDEQLTKAKEIIEKLLNAFASNDFFEEEKLSAIAEAEQFLKESE